MTSTGHEVTNDINFPQGDLSIENANTIYEVPNAFPFWGTTYILGKIAENNGSIGLDFSFEPHGQTRFSDIQGLKYLNVSMLPRPILLAIAQTCTNPEILIKLCPFAAEFEYSEEGTPSGLKFYENSDGTFRPKILDHDLYETLGNNPYLPDKYKVIMLLSPGVQGTSPIVGEYLNGEHTHIWEYLRSNSYIPWGHYAANMAHDSIRYSVKELDLHDITGLRHLYYQRIYTQMAVELGAYTGIKGLLSPEDLDILRQAVLKKIEKTGTAKFTATLWGWNYGYDFSPSGFRLHASHQQIHQQFALIPEAAEHINKTKGYFPSYAVGDNVALFISIFQDIYKVPFFDKYIKAIKENERLDQRRDLPRKLIVFEDEQVMLFAPKAQRSQGELQIMCLKPIGNILEADVNMRASLDKAILIAVKVLSALGARMITCFEISKRFTEKSDQRLMYCFLPKHPQSPGAFSEQQARWITGHFPEDFAACCRKVLTIH